MTYHLYLHTQILTEGAPKCGQSQPQLLPLKSAFHPAVERRLLPQQNADHSFYR